jgi:hypothetical protein
MTALLARSELECRRTEMQFIALTEDGAKVAASIMVNVDEIAFYRAETRSHPEGDVNCGILTMRHGGVLRVKEDLDTFRSRLALATPHS